MSCLIVFLSIFFPIISYLFAKNNSKRYFSVFHIVFMSLFFIFVIYISVNNLSVEWVLYQLNNDVGLPQFTLGFQLDALSGLIGLTVLLIGTTVSKYSVRYLDDDPQQMKFLRNLAVIQSGILLLLMSQNLLVFWLAWFFVSFKLHGLLLHFHDRSAARKAAYQKFWVSRLGDCFLLTASFLFYQAFGSLDFHVIFNQAADIQFRTHQLDFIQWGVLLLILGAMTKSAQFPFHYWLPNTMETPTPVSALMHAGIINAGGYLIIRMSPLLVLFPTYLCLLAIVGALTALYGILVMSTQTQVKQQLAYSTIAQMGFMMLQCGLGIFTAAVVHLIGHAFYKAHAFLSSGSVTDYGRLNRYYPQLRQTVISWEQSISSILFASLLTFFFSWFFMPVKPVKYLLLFILALAVVQVLRSTEDKVSNGIYALLIFGSYMVLFLGTESLLQGLLPLSFTHPISLLGPLAFLLIVLFIVLYLIQNHMTYLRQTRLGTWLYVQLYNGFYWGK